MTEIRTFSFSDYESASEWMESYGLSYDHSVWRFFHAPRACMSVSQPKSNQERIAKAVGMGRRLHSASEIWKLPYGSGGAALAGYIVYDDRREVFVAYMDKSIPLLVTSA